MGQRRSRYLAVMLIVVFALDGSGRPGWVITVPAAIPL
jgi:hypothetical protein